MPHPDIIKNKTICETEYMLSALKSDMIRLSRYSPILVRSASSCKELLRPTGYYRLIKMISFNSLFRCLFSTAFLTYLVLAQGQGYTIQVAATKTEAEALAMINDYNSAGVEAYLVKSDVPGKGTRYRVRFGRFPSQVEAKSAAERSRDKGLIKEFFITTYEMPTVVSVKTSLPQAKVSPVATVATGV